MSGSGEHNAGLLRPPVHPSRSTVLPSPPCSPNLPPRPPIHPSHSSANLSPNLQPLPPPYASPKVSPTLPAPPMDANPNTSTTPVQLPPSFNPGPSPAQVPENILSQTSPSLPPRTNVQASSLTFSPKITPRTPGALLDEDPGSDTEVDEHTTMTTTTSPSSLGTCPSTDTLVSSIGSKDEEELSEIQLRELYDDEEIDRFLKVFSTYVREVRTVRPQAGPAHSGDSASASVPAMAGQDSVPPTCSPESPGGSPQTSWDAPLSERVAIELVVPLLPPPRAPPPDFSLGRMKQTASRLFVAAEPLYSQIGVPLLKLAIWKDTKKSFGYCAMYWILWYHGLLLSALTLGLLYELIRRKLHPYPTLVELREHRRRIDRSQAFSTLLATRLSAAPAFGLRDVWGIFGDYRRLRKLKKPKECSRKDGTTDATEDTMNGEDTSSVRSVSFSTSESLDDNSAQQSEEDADLKRLGLFLLNEVADLLERLKNVFLWRDPTASAICGAAILCGFIFGLLPARYLVKIVGFAVGALFWHVIPVVAAIPESERKRIPSPLSFVPTDIEYAMELISQRVARGLPVKPRRKRPGRQTSESSVFEAEGESAQGSSSSVNWKRVGERVASTKEKVGDIKGIFCEGQWKKSENWKALNPLAPKVVTSQSGPEPRIETQTFPATMKTRGPGLITLTPTTLVFTCLLSSQPVLTMELADVTGVKKVTMTKGLDIHYSHQQEDGKAEEKQVSFQLVGARSELFARLVSAGGNKWAKM